MLFCYNGLMLKRKQLGELSDSTYKVFVWLDGTLEVGTTIPEDLENLDFVLEADEGFGTTFTNAVYRGTKRAILLSYSTSTQEVTGYWLTSTGNELDGRNYFPAPYPLPQGLDLQYVSEPFHENPADEFTVKSMGEFGGIIVVEGVSNYHDYDSFRVFAVGDSTWSVERDYGTYDAKHLIDGPKTYYVLAGNVNDNSWEHQLVFGVIDNTTGTVQEQILDYNDVDTWYEIQALEIKGGKAHVLWTTFSMAAG